MLLYALLVSAPASQGALVATLENLGSCEAIQGVYPDAVCVTPPEPEAKKVKAVPSKPKGQPKSRKGKAEPKITCSPRIGMSGGFQIAPITVRLRVKNPGEKFWEPEVRWYINDNFVAAQQGDSPPYEEIVAERGEHPEFWYGPTKRFGLMQGNFTITVRLARNGKTFRRLTCNVMVH
jgi:hypothetical protein